MVAIPLPLAVIFPKESTLTTLLFDEYQFMTAPHGKAVTSILPELLPDETLLLKLMYGVYAGAGFLTVTVQEAYFPLLVFAVIVAVPDFLPVTMPFEETVATFLFEVLHFTLLPFPDILNISVFPVQIFPKVIFMRAFASFCLFTDGFTAMIPQFFRL